MKTSSSPSVSAWSTTYTADSVINTVITIPPDGGWGWLIVAASLVSSVIVDGSMYTFGIHLNDISASLDIPPTTVAIASSITNACYYCFGAVTCALVNHYGFQLIGVIGGVIASSGYLSASMMTSTPLFFLTIGFITGIGLGMIYVPSIVVVGFYFERWRSMATSIAVTGSALGLVLIPIVNEQYLQGFHWRTKFKMIAGCMMFAGLLAILYKPLKPTRILKRGNQIVRIEDKDSIDSVHKSQTTHFYQIFTKFHNKKYPTAAEITAENEMLTFDNIDVMTQSSTSFIITTTENVRERPDETRSQLSTVYEVSENESKSKWWWCCPPCRKGRKLCRTFRRKHQANRPMYRDDILYQGSLNMLAQYSRSLGTTSYISRITTNTNIPVSLEYHMSVSRVATARDLENKRACCPESIVRILATMFDFSLLKLPSFVLMATSGFLTCLGMYIPFIYSINRGEEVGIEQSEATLLLSVLGISNGIGRILSGMVSSIPGANALLVTYISLVVCGVSTIISCSLYGLLMQYIYMSAYGLTIACVGSLRPPMIVELFGIENLTNAYGLIFFFQGLAAFSGVPLAGQLKVLSGTYQACFYFAGVSIVISGMLLVPAKRVRAWEKKKMNGH